MLSNLINQHSKHSQLLQPLLPVSLALALPILFPPQIPELLELSLLISITTLTALHWYPKLTMETSVQNVFKMETLGQLPTSYTEKISKPCFPKLQTVPPLVLHPQVTQWVDLIVSNKVENTLPGTEVKIFPSMPDHGTSMEPSKISWDTQPFSTGDSENPTMVKIIIFKYTQGDNSFKILKLNIPI